MPPPKCARSAKCSTPISRRRDLIPRGRWRGSDRTGLPPRAANCARDRCSSRTRRSHHVTTAWIDLRDCDRSKVADIVAAAAENQIEAIVTNSEISKLVGTRPPGIQWVAFGDAGEGFGAMNGADVHVHASHDRANGLLVLALKLSDKDGILIDVDGKERLDEACAAVGAGAPPILRFRRPANM